jgi:hypothetical protein
VHSSSHPAILHGLGVNANFAFVVVISLQHCMAEKYKVWIAYRFIVCIPSQLIQIAYRAFMWQVAAQDSVMKLLECCHLLVCFPSARVNVTIRWFMV